MVKRRLILVLLVSCVLLCCTAQAITLRVSVTDEKTGGALVDASVYIDGTYMGSTASDGTYSYYHSGEKDLRLKVVRTGYKDWVEYVDADRTSVSVKMVRKNEILRFELYDALTLKPIVGALVRVEGDGVSSSGTTGSDGSTDFSVKAGALYNVEVRTSGYYDLSKTVQMESDNKVVQVLALQEQSPCGPGPRRHDVYSHQGCGGLRRRCACGDDRRRWQAAAQPATGEEILLQGHGAGLPALSGGALPRCGHCAPPGGPLEVGIPALDNGLQ